MFFNEYDYTTICIGLTPLYRIGPGSEVGRLTGAMPGKVFYGRTDGQTADKKRRKNFFLGSPLVKALLAGKHRQIGVPPRARDET